MGKTGNKTVLTVFPACAHCLWHCLCTSVYLGVWTGCLVLGSAIPFCPLQFGLYDSFWISPYFRYNTQLLYISNSVTSNFPWQASVSPAHERGDDDTPGGAAAVGVRRFFALPTATAQPEGVEEEEEEVQSKAGQRHSPQQQQRLKGKNTVLLHSLELVWWLMQPASRLIKEMGLLFATQDKKCSRNSCSKGCSHDTLILLKICVLEFSFEKEMSVEGCV